MSGSKKEESFYIINYKEAQDGKVTTLKAKKISDSSLGPSFLSISDFLFDDTSPLVNPKEEGLKERFKDTLSLHLSIFYLISIEEVGLSHPGLKFKKDKSNLVIFSTDSKPH